MCFLLFVAVVNFAMLAFPRPLLTLLLLMPFYSFASELHATKSAKLRHLRADLYDMGGNVRNSVLFSAVLAFCLQHPHYSIICIGPFHRFKLNCINKIATIGALEGAGVGSLFPPTLQAYGTESVGAALAFVIWEL